MSILINILLGLNVFVALLMILVILMQRPKSEGLGAAFGGGVTENIFGAQTTNVLTKITGWLAGIFFGLTFILSILYAERSVGGSSLRRELLRSQAASGAAQTQSATPGPTVTTQSPLPSARQSSTPTASAAAPAAALGTTPAQPQATPVPTASSPASR